MAGLSMGMGGFGGQVTATALPNAASQPGSMTVTQAAFGITAGAGGDDWAAKGSLVAGVVGAALLVFLWHSLPR